MSEKGQYKCEICGLEFDYFDNFNSHVMHCHPNELREVQDKFEAIYSEMENREY